MTFFEPKRTKKLQDAGLTPLRAISKNFGFALFFILIQHLQSSDFKPYGEDLKFQQGPPFNWKYEFLNDFSKKQSLADIPGLIVYADENWIVKNEISYVSLSNSTTHRAQTFLLYFISSKTLKLQSVFHGPNLLRDITASPDGNTFFLLTGGYMGEDPRLIGPKMGLLAVSPHQCVVQLQDIYFNDRFSEEESIYLELNDYELKINIPQNLKNRISATKFAEPFNDFNINVKTRYTSPEQSSFPERVFGNSELFPKSGLPFLAEKFETGLLRGIEYDGQLGYEGLYEMLPPIIHIDSLNNSLCRTSIIRQYISGKKIHVGLLNINLMKFESIGMDTEKRKIYSLTDNKKPNYEPNVNKYDSFSVNKTLDSNRFITKYELSGIGAASFSVSWEGTGDPDINFSELSGTFQAFLISPPLDADVSSLYLIDYLNNKIIKIANELPHSKTLAIKKIDDGVVQIYFSCLSETCLFQVNLAESYKNPVQSLILPGFPHMGSIEPSAHTSAANLIRRWPVPSFLDHSKNLLYVNKQDGFDVFQIFQKESPIKLYEVYLNSLGEYAVRLPNGIYSGSPGCENSLISKISPSELNAEDIAAWRNRPAEVLKALGGEPAQIEILSKVTDRWLKKLGNPERNPEPTAADIPSLALANDVPLWAKGEAVDLRFTAKPGTAPVKEVIVRVNGVDQQRDSNAVAGKSEVNRSIKIAEGQNWIEAVAIDEKGRSSNLVRFRTILRESAKPNKRYIIAIGVSKYRDSALNLEFAAKDATDLAAAIKESTRGETEVLLLTNEQATKGAPAKIREFLAAATENDEVIAFCAGHGVLDSNLDYVYASHEFDSASPSETGIKLDELVDAIGSSKSLKRLLLLDTCHSGQVGEKDEMLLAQMDTELPKGVRAVKQRGMSVKPIAGLSAEGQQRFIEEMFLLPGLHRGINIIGASGGAEFALESAQWNNGVFTASIIEALREKKADLNEDGRVSVGELRNFLAQRVSELTKGAQKPSVVAAERDQDFELIRASYTRNAPVKEDQGVPPARQIWLFHDSSDRILSRDELRLLSQDQLWRARNEIFARRGYIFKTEKGKDLATSLGDAFKPVSSDLKVIGAHLNHIEKANIDAIQKFEKK